MLATRLLDEVLESTCYLLYLGPAPVAHNFELRIPWDVLGPQEVYYFVSEQHEHELALSTSLLCESSQSGGIFVVQSEKEPLGMNYRCLLSGPVVAVLSPTRTAAFGHTAHLFEAFDDQVWL